MTDATSATDEWSWATRDLGTVTRRMGRGDAEAWARMGEKQGREVVTIVPANPVDSLQRATPSEPDSCDGRCAHAPPR